MRYFVAISEEAMLRLWMRDPNLLRPFARPFQVRPECGAAANDVRRPHKVNPETDDSPPAKK